MNVPSLIDLSGVVAIVASSGAVTALLQWLRDVALDGWTAAMPDRQRNAILRALLLVLNAAAILGLSLLMGTPLSGALLVSAALAAFLGAAGSHTLYAYVQKPAAQRYGVPEAAGVAVEPPMPSVPNVLPDDLPPDLPPEPVPPAVPSPAPVPAPAPDSTAASAPTDRPAR